MNKEEIFLNYLWISKSLKSALSTVCIFSFVLSPSLPYVIWFPWWNHKPPRRELCPIILTAQPGATSLPVPPPGLAPPQSCPYPSEMFTVFPELFLWSLWGVQRDLNNWASPRNLQLGRGCRGNPPLMEWSLPFSPTEGPRARHWPRRRCQLRSSPPSLRGCSLVCKHLRMSTWYKILFENPENLLHSEQLVQRRETTTSSWRCRLVLWVCIMADEGGKGRDSLSALWYVSMDTSATTSVPTALVLCTQLRPKQHGYYANFSQTGVAS